MDYVSHVVFMLFMRASNLWGTSLISKSIMLNAMLQIRADFRSFLEQSLFLQPCNSQFKQPQESILKELYQKINSKKGQRTAKSRFKWWQNAFTASFFTLHSQFWVFSSWSKATSFTDTYLEVRQTLNISQTILAKYSPNIRTIFI
jgi:hypothetical protein